MASESTSNLPPTTTFVTGHNATGKAEVQSSRPATWKMLDHESMGFNVIWTTHTPSDLNEDKDVKKHDDLMAKGNLGLVNKGGSVCRMVDFGPGVEGLMHRTQSLDYGIVIEGEIEMVLDDGSVSVLRRGDIAVQRATMHAWRNPSKTEWVRMVFVLQDCQPLTVKGERYGEDLGVGAAYIPASKNDD